MAKYDGIGLSSSWSGTFELLNYGGAIASCDYMEVSVPFGSARLEFVDVIFWDPVDHDPGDPGEGPPGINWVGVYAGYRLKVTAGIDLMALEEEEQLYYLWTGDSWTDTPPDPGGVPGIINYSFSIKLDWAISLSGITMDAEATDSVPSDRGFLWFGDRSHSEEWVADGASVTVTAGNLSVTETDIGIADGGLSLGTNVAAHIQMAARLFSAVDTVYFLISDLKWDDIDVDLSNLSLYKPGDAGFIPVPGDGWSREESVADRARVGNDGGMAMWAEGTYSSAADWDAVLYAPFQVTFKPRDGKFGYH